MANSPGWVVTERLNLSSGLRTIHIKKRGSLPDLDAWCRIRQILADELKFWNSWLDEDGWYHLYIAWKRQVS